MTIREFNESKSQVAQELIARCCGADNWIRHMEVCRPYANRKDLIQKAREVWATMDARDVLQAFDHHPKIGEKKKEDRKLSSTRSWAKHEQGGVDESDQVILDRLMEANHAYENKFGYIFIVSATGKTGEEMLSLLEARMSNGAEEEFRIAKEEQRKITEIRIKKWIDSMSRVTTHVLDTSRGYPAEGIKITLQLKIENQWVNITSGITNNDGRISNFLPDSVSLDNGIYQMRFDTKPYFERLKIQAFYPYVTVVFEIREDGHYHVPLLLNPFGYSTYRGS